MTILGEGDFEAAMAAGRELKFADGIGYALGEEWPDQAMSRR